MPNRVGVGIARVGSLQELVPLLELAPLIDLATDLVLTHYG